MKIAILGAGVMGTLFGAYLSRKNDVLMVCRREEAAAEIREKGVRITENGGNTACFYPDAICGAEQPADLVILFVKGNDSRTALEQHRGLIGKDTMLLSLQNGGGHDEDLLCYADREHVLIGTTQQGAKRGEDGSVVHTGAGLTKIGGPDGLTAAAERVAEAMDACGMPAEACPDVKRLVWEKLFTNASASVLTGVLQVTIDRVAAVPETWALCERLVREAVAAAAAEGIVFDADTEIGKVRAVCENSPGGITSICADLSKGRRTEVEHISGTVVRSGRRTGCPVPTHEAMVNLVHSLEARNAQQK